MGEVLFIAFMYFWAFMVAPVIGLALWLGFEGDKMREQQFAEAEPQPTPTITLEGTTTRETTPSTHTAVA